MLTAYIEKAVERRDKLSRLDLDRLTLAVNTGTLITYDRDALRRWKSRHRRPSSPQEQSASLNRLARMFPGKVQTQ